MAASKKDCRSEDARRLLFFKGPLPLSGTPIIVAIPRERNGVDDELFVLGIMTKKTKELSKDLQYEYTVGDPGKSFLV